MMMIRIPEYVFLTDTTNVRAEVVPGNPPFRAPIWQPEWSTLLIANVRSQADWLQLEDETFGSSDSGMDASDWLRFNNSDLLLGGVEFRVSENNADFATFASIWTNCPTLTGTLRISRRYSFSFCNTFVRWVHPAGLALANFLQSVPLQMEKIWRLNLARDFYLLFSGDQFFGWLLDNPATYIQEYWPVDGSSLQKDHLNQLVVEFCSVVSSTNVQLMLDEDPGVL
jgi:hypothetical protein